MADFGNIYIGGKHFTSLQEAIEYKKQHPEWDGIGQIIEDGDLRDMIELIEQQGGTDSHQQAQNQHPGKNPALHLHVVEDIAQIDGNFILVRVGYDQIDLGIVIQQRPVLLPVFFIVVRCSSAPRLSYPSSRLFLKRDLIDIKVCLLRRYQIFQPRFSGLKE